MEAIWIGGYLDWRLFGWSGSNVVEIWIGLERLALELLELQWLYLIRNVIIPDLRATTESDSDKNVFKGLK